MDRPSQSLLGVISQCDATVRLISVSKLVRDPKLEGHFDDEKCCITNKGPNILIAVGTLYPTRNLCTISHPVITTHFAFTTEHNADFAPWHRRLRHANYQDIMALQEKTNVSSETWPSHYGGRFGCSHVTKENKELMETAKASNTMRPACRAGVIVFFLQCGYGEKGDDRRYAHILRRQVR